MLFDFCQPVDVKFCWRNSLYREINYRDRGREILRIFEILNIIHYVVECSGHQYCFFLLVCSNILVSIVDSFIISLFYFIFLSFIMFSLFSLWPLTVSC